jgi:DNA helicase IV
LGDIAQGTTPWATADWPSTLRHLGKPDAHVEVLEQGYRVPAKVIDFACRLLPRIAPGLAAPVAVRENPGILDVIEVPHAELRAATLRATRGALDYDGSVAVMAADTEVTSLSTFFNSAAQSHLVLGTGGSHQRVTLVPVSLAKGLEYDHVVVMEPADIVAGEPEEWLGLRRLYVVLTRAVSGLTVVHARALPAELMEPAVA